MTNLKQKCYIFRYGLGHFLKKKLRCQTFFFVGCTILAIEKYEKMMHQLIHALAQKDIGVVAYRRLWDSLTMPHESDYYFCVVLYLVIVVLLVF